MSDDLLELQVREVEEAILAFRTYQHDYAQYAVALTRGREQITSQTFGKFAAGLSSALAAATARTQSTAAFCAEFAVALERALKQIETIDKANALKMADDPELPPKNSWELFHKLNYFNQDHLHPIRLFKIGSDEYVVGLAGTDLKATGSNGAISAVQGYLGYESAYATDVKIVMQQHIPENATVHFVGYSLGGITSTNLAQDGDLLQRYTIGSVTTYGAPTAPLNHAAPINAEASDGTFSIATNQYLQFTTPNDPIPHLRNGEHDEQSLNLYAFVTQQGGTTERVPNQIVVDGNAHGGYAQSESLKRYPLMFDPGEWRYLGGFATDGTRALPR